MDLDLNCDRCKGICNVISGFGGSIHYGDSIKLSGYPAGRRLFSHLGEELYWDLERDALGFFEKTNFEFFRGDIHFLHGRNIRQYPIIEISESELQSWLNATQNRVNGFAQVKLRTKVHSVERSKCNNYIVNFSDASGTFTAHYDFLILATGRAGFSTTYTILMNNGVTMHSPRVSLGIRVELPADILAPIYQIHPDFKSTKFYSGIKVKSFCFSSTGFSGGRLKYCHYQAEFPLPLVFLDGHSRVNEFEQMTTERKGNFALLAQLAPEKDLNWLKRDFATRYYQLSCGKPVFETLSDFVKANIGSKKSLRPTVSDCKSRCVDSLIPEPEVSALREALVDFIRFAAKINRRSFKDILVEGVVVAPDVEFFWPTVNVSDNFETNARGLYVIGDAAGIAQGNLQGAISGLAAARALASQLRHSKSNARGDG